MKRYYRHFPAFTKYFRKKKWPLLFSAVWQKGTPANKTHSQKKKSLFKKVAQIAGMHKKMVKITHSIGRIGNLPFNFRKCIKGGEKLDTRQINRDPKLKKVDISVVNTLKLGAHHSFITEFSHT